MKKYIITITLAFGFGIGLNAQNDGFFASNYSEYRESENDWGLDMPLLPGSHGYLDDYSCAEQAPLGSGIILLAGMALGYAMRKRE
ncbi:MAG: hypothetical protein IJZ87_09590 [Bacteroidales bacterium]|nr:hypothetical protein [Bacteroidales bacterium]